MLRNFKVTIELDIFETNVKAKNKVDARKKALLKLDKRKPSLLVSKSWPSHRRNINVFDWD